VPEGTLSSRLAQAKKLLARRLSRYGTVAVAALLAQGMASGCLSPVLRASTVKAVLTAEAVPAKVLVLTEGVLKAMFLSKLKITVCAAMLMVLAGIGATGLTYRATAQQPKQGVALASRAQADDLEALRLEIEALRKSLQATRERVRTLEVEVSEWKGKSSGPAGMPRMPGGVPGAQPGANGQPAQPGAPGAQPGAPGGQPNMPAGKRSGGMRPPGMMGSGKNPIDQGIRYPDLGIDAGFPIAPADPVADAEAALKKLRENPGDKQATEALERALTRLKEREKPRGLGGQ
jgi:hypothetical protein